MGPGWSAAILSSEQSRYVALAQKGFSDGRTYYTGGSTYINPGHHFSYGFYYKNYHQNYNGKFTFNSCTSLLQCRHFT